MSRTHLKPKSVLILRCAHYQVKKSVGNIEKRHEKSDRYSKVVLILKWTLREVSLQYQLFQLTTSYTNIVNLLPLHECNNVNNYLFVKLTVVQLTHAVKLQ